VKNRASICKCFRALPESEKRSVPLWASHGGTAVISRRDIMSPFADSETRNAVHSSNKFFAHLLPDSKSISFRLIQWRICAFRSHKNSLLLVVCDFLKSPLPAASGHGQNWCVFPPAAGNFSPSPLVFRALQKQVTGICNPPRLCVSQ
jgi:hypothetical protein